MATGQDRVVALVDMDCFFVQVEQRQNPHLRNKPCAVVQYKSWKGGGIIAVSYEARAFGVTRNMWADDAKKLCPDLLLAQVRESRGKANLTKYREASVEVMGVMSHFAVIERASIDEAYVDLTSAVQERLQKLQGQPISADLLPTTYVEGLPQSPTPAKETVQKEEMRKQGLHQWLDSLQIDNTISPDLQLTVGAVIVEEMRAAIERQTGFQCSAGISHNKVLAKLACGLNKPNRQTLVSQGSVPQLFSQMPIRKIRSLGGKLGASVIEVLGVEYMGELTQFTESQLQNHFGEKNGSWLYAMCRGIEHDPVKPRQLPKTIGCSKNFPGKTALATREQVQWWLLQLAQELEERLTKDQSDNDRVATQLVVSIRVQGDKRLSSLRRCCALTRYDAYKMSQDAFAVIRNCNTSGIQTEWSPPLTMLFLCATKFSVSGPGSCTDITAFLSGDSSSLPKVPVTSSEAKTQGSDPAVTATKKATTFLESFFQKVAEKQKAKQASCSSLTAATQTPMSKSSSKPPLFFQTSKTTGIEPFFKQKSLLLKQKQTSNSSVSLHPQNSQANSKGSPNYFPTEHLERGPVCDKPLKLDSSKAVSTEEDLTHNSLAMPAFSALQSLEVAPKAVATSCLLAAEDQLPCDKCGSLVPVWEMPEHMDYHFALELQKSFLQPQSSTPQAVPAASPQKKRDPKSPLACSNKRPRPEGMQTLESFFKPLTH
ncbi:DNA polymerase eta isoform X1 [Heterocephalus glaber]|uniref:DNA polymerase eta n=1 Tax=Heterocephalus glaber TaxID=10181 RepID=A0AAX6P980_HETGA|nr:DNA polymerase eta isoform X1 [Heterocephalus glaber]XP_004846543.1 DNA polymerase eta isoform X1 [Heterocephalus glaber]XP_021115417.1 DNA polymerase eta isoform X1 [Heterocephalus glaber]XP_021115419.1 DNA polymerase eta isoform X1 [Heterocephalus glaber]XP_021115420.1 DNA polymerase eta isoform X1 [Heterocephalus glaber]XP_021115421.1 DNA polymerase eta isoform X1 [Heterocephalus glaber]